MTQSFIFLGPPASGKGTQAKVLAQKIGAVWFGVGDLMRAESKKQSHYGKIFQKVWDQGKGSLVNDNTVLNFVKEKMAEMGQDKGFVFDGFPRTLKQAEFLDQLLKHHLIVLNIEVSEDSIVKRSSTRKVCENCYKVFFEAPKDKRNCETCGGELIHRQEDLPEVVKKRIEVYDRETKPLIEYYKKKNILIEIDGEPNISEVSIAIENKVHEIRNKS